ncbi:hypothetical protein L1857_31190 [Amycolatopsis thermalba]|uniref:Uncharacterized protein n=1 Tax=Amycolatopsis thermalba TaxID=944492 RepID=A0ABY4P414_9PSEU|nr:MULTISPECIES: hypothetical protein [Amycolatopsis]UQS26948.1 hypothetical protein L1857_31190 [Amycolatopsis thermalba]
MAPTVRIANRSQSRPLGALAFTNATTSHPTAISSATSRKATNRFGRRHNAQFRGSMARRVLNASRFVFGSALPGAAWRGTELRSSMG